MRRVGGGSGRRGPGAWWRLALVALALVGTFAWGGPVGAVVVLDQELLPSECPPANFMAPMSWAQTFTAGRSGPLTQVELHVGAEGAATVAVQLHATSGGAPLDPPLASATLSIAAPTEPDWQAAAFAAPVAVAAGTQYAIAIFQPSATVSWSCAAAYAGGGGFILDPFNGRDSWTAFGPDHALRTYVDEAAPTTTGAVGGAATYGDATATLTATVTSGGNPVPPGGAVAFTFDGQTYPATTDAQGVATASAPLPPGTGAGSYPGAVQAAYAGATGFAPSAGEGTLVVARAAQAIDFPQPPARTYGDPPFTASATATSGLPVGFAVAPPGVCTASGPNGATITLVGPGDCTVTASQAGDANHLPAAPVARTFGVLVPLTVTVQGPGTVNPGSGDYAAGAGVTLVASPSPGAVFVGWRVDGAAAGWANPLTLTLDAPRTVEARFAVAPTFGDLPIGHPAAEAVAELGGRGIVVGYVGGTFGPGDPLERAQLAALVARAMPAGLGTPTNGTLAPPACLAPGTWDCEDWGNGFADRGGTDANLWRNVGALAHYGLVAGYDDARCAARGVAAPCFGPADAATHEQVLAVIARALIAQGYWLPQPGAPVPPGVAPEYAEAVATFLYYTGGPATPANWAAPAARGWSAQALWLALDSYWGTDGVLPDGRPAGGAAD